jgi:hypothetical protein
LKRDARIKKELEFFHSQRQIKEAQKARIEREKM